MFLPAAPGGVALTRRDRRGQCQPRRAKAVTLGWQAKPLNTDRPCNIKNFILNW